MMSEWWTYNISDLILFSAHTYYRLIELYNESIWPLQLLSIPAGFALPFLVWRKPDQYRKFIVILLALCWIWIAWAFHWQRFANIHWVASYFAITFVIQGILLAWTALINNSLNLQSGSTHRYAGTAIIIFAVVLQPFIMIIAGNSWKQSELFGITPGPTVVATIGFLLLTQGRKNWWLFVIPVIWCIISAATLWVLKSPNALTMAITGLLAISFILWKEKTEPQ